MGGNTLYLLATDGITLLLNQTPRLVTSPKYPLNQLYLYRYIDLSPSMYLIIFVDHYCDNACLDKPDRPKVLVVRCPKERIHYYIGDHSGNVTNDVVIYSKKSRRNILYTFVIVLFFSIACIDCHAERKNQKVTEFFGTIPTDFGST